MNFFTKEITSQDMASICCSSYKPGVYNNQDSTGSLLSLFKLDYENQHKVSLDPAILIATFFYRPEWEEGWALIQNQLESFLSNNGPLSGTSVDLSTVEKRISVFTSLVSNKMFIRKDLRLKIIEAIEALE